MPDMLPTKEINRATLSRFQSYDSSDVHTVLEIYTDDAQYWDTKASSGIRGKADLQKYLTGFFARFHTRFAILEEHRLEGLDGAIVLWECAVRRRLPEGGLSEELIMQRGMNLLLVRDARICRDECYMDLGSLDQLFEQTSNSTLPT
jgi:ketosteroid isomerase-like protein